MMRPGARNLITDVPGLRVGNAADPRLKSGVTVLTADRPFVAGVDVRGGAPGTRETDLLAPGRMVEAVDAIVLSGGSAFGLDAAAGVMDRLARPGPRALAAGVRVPIVPAAILFDLANGGDKDWGGELPTARSAPPPSNAAAADFALGTAGAGTGAMTATVKGGLGSASLVLEDGATVGALVAVNAFGTVLLPGRPRLLGRAVRDRRRVRRPRRRRRRCRRRCARRKPWPAARAATPRSPSSPPTPPSTRPAPAPGRGRPGRPRPRHLPGAHVVRRRPRLRRLHRRQAGRPPLGTLVLEHAAALCLTRAVARAVHAARPRPATCCPAGASWPSA